MAIIYSRMRWWRRFHVEPGQLTGKGWLGAGVLAFSMLWVTGCSIIPPASIRYLESLPKGALQQANPQDVRVAINLPKGVRMTNLVADITGEAQNDKVAARLPFHAVPKVEALSSASTGGSGNWIYYALTKEGINGFKKIQVFVSRHPLGSGPTTITVKTHNKLNLANCNRERKVPLLAAILLDPNHGYVVIWNGKESLSDLASPQDRICTSNSG